MHQIVSITSQGQLTVPKQFRKALGIKEGIKAIIHLKGKQLVVEPQHDFWSLGGSLSGKVTLTDKELKEAKKAFARQWSEKQ